MTTNMTRRQSIAIKFATALLIAGLSDAATGVKAQQLQPVSVIVFPGG